VLRIGIDLGGSKIEAAALAADGALLERRRLPTPRGDYPGTLEAVRRLVTRLEAKLGEEALVGIGTPGSLSPASGLMRNANSVCLNGMPLDKDLERVLQRPVRMANDADCFALSEAMDGAGRGAHSLFGVIIGTGTGAGIVIDRHLLQGPNAVAGEWGHNPLPWPCPEELPGPQCYCGKRGCIETFLSGPGLSRSHEQTTGQRLDPDEIDRLAQQGDAAAERTLGLYEDRLARGLASVINVLDPEVIVLGGGLSNLQRLYRNVPGRLSDYVFSECVRTRLLPPVHGDSSGVRGAAWLHEA
jgi:fructokinase